MELRPRGAQQLREVSHALDVLQSTKVSHVPYSPVFALFAEQPPGGRPGVWRRAGLSGSGSVPRLSLLYPHVCLFSSADPLSRQERRPRNLIISVVFIFVLWHSPGQKWFWERERPGARRALSTASHPEACQVPQH